MCKQACVRKTACAPVRIEGGKERRDRKPGARTQRKPTRREKKTLKQNERTTNNERSRTSQRTKERKRKNSNHDTDRVITLMVRLTTCGLFPVYSFFLFRPIFSWCEDGRGKEEEGREGKRRGEKGTKVGRKRKKAWLAGRGEGKWERRREEEREEREKGRRGREGAWRGVGEARPLRERNREKPGNRRGSLSLGLFCSFFIPSFRSRSRFPIPLSLPTLFSLSPYSCLSLPLPLPPSLPTAPLLLSPSISSHGPSRSSPFPSPFSLSVSFSFPFLSLSPRFPSSFRASMPCPLTLM